MTAFAWVKGVSQTTKGILAKYGSPGNSWYLGTHTTDGSKFSIFLSGDGTVVHKKYKSSITVFDNTIHFIAFTYDGNNTLNLYADGIIDPAPVKEIDTALTTLFDSYQAVGMACFGMGAGRFTGSIYLAGAYSTCLNDSKIAKLYSTTKNMLIQRGLVI